MTTAHIFVDQSNFNWNFSAETRRLSSRLSNRLCWPDPVAPLCRLDCKLLHECLLRGGYETDFGESNPAKSPTVTHDGLGVVEWCLRSCFFCQRVVCGLL